MAVIEARDRRATRKQVLPSKALIALAFVSVAMAPRSKRALRTRREMLRVACQLAVSIAIAFYKRYGFLEFPNTSNRLFSPTNTIRELFLQNEGPSHDVSQARPEPPATQS